MKIYDDIINKTMNLLDKDLMKSLKIDKEDMWPDVGKYNFILKRDMAYELGGSNLPAVVELGLTSSESIVYKDEIVLYGPDLFEIKNNSPYARVTFLRVNDDNLGEGDEAYAAIRKIEYTRYHINPKGYMMRISVANEREPVRISKEALNDGLDFKAVGNLFLSEYHKNPNVLAVKVIFITDPKFDYKELERLSKNSDEITETLNHIFKNIKMDCSVCNLKPICDEVDGMKEMHLKQEAVKNS